MKVALQFTGQLRNFEYSYQFFKEFLLDYINPDIFLSTWEDPNVELFKELYKNCICRTDPHTKEFLHNNNLQLLIHQAKFGYQDPNTKNYNMICGLYHKYMCNQLRMQYETQNNIKYDVIIVTRPDLILAEPFNIELLNYTKDYLLIPAGSDWECGTNDLFAVGNPHNINIYCNLIVYLPIYISTPVILNPEHLLKYHLDEKSVPIKRFSYTTHLRSKKMT